MKRFLVSILVLLTLASCYSRSAITNPTTVGEPGTFSGPEVDSKKRLIEQQQEVIKRQGVEIERQKKEIEDLKRQQFHNESLRRYEGGI